MDKKNMTYTEAMQRLETIVAKINDGSLDIDTLTTQLKEAKQLIAFCKTKLTKVEGEVKKILED